MGPPLYARVCPWSSDHLGWGILPLGSDPVTKLYLIGGSLGSAGPVRALEEEHMEMEIEAQKIYWGRNTYRKTQREEAELGCKEQVNWLPEMEEYEAQKIHYVP